MPLNYSQIHFQQVRVDFSRVFNCAVTYALFFLLNSDPATRQDATAKLEAAARENYVSTAISKYCVRPG